jgi:L-threonylcarbamoyladenylate synthase
VREPVTSPCPVGDDVVRAAELLRGGGLVAFATETVYGLGANALDVSAVARVFEAKQRPTFDPLIVHVAELDDLRPLLVDLPSPARLLAERFWPGPLTLVLPKSDVVPDLVTAGLDTVAVRVPGHEQARELLRQAGVPVAAPSANPFGQVSPTRAAHVVEQLGDRIDYVLDGGPCRVGVESSVLDLSRSRPVLLRPGGVPVEELEAVVGPVSSPDASDLAKPHAPGMLPKHYAPRTPLRIRTGGNDDLSEDARIGRLAFTTPQDRERFAAVEVLSPTGDLAEAAANFFAALRRLDAADVTGILADPFPDHGLGRALNDRLRRAASDAE